MKRQSMRPLTLTLSFPSIGSLGWRDVTDTRNACPLLSLDLGCLIETCLLSQAGGGSPELIHECMCMSVCMCGLFLHPESPPTSLTLFFMSVSCL